MATSRIADSVGRVLGDRYRLSRPLGVGASAHVYVADDVALRRRVAIKVLHPALAADEAFLRRFRAEAQVVASLRHPNILTVYDWGEDGGSPYLVMELLEGGSLRALLDRGYLLTPAQAAAVGADAARALDYAHRRGLVHRDVKPANLIFDDEGRVRVADFGVARALAEATWTEPMGAVVGTARYAAPEQARGEQLDGRADVYALAVVLVEAAAGIVPFAADTTIGTLMARVERPLEVPDSLGDLKPILEQAGTVGAGDRLDAGALARALEEAARSMDPPAPLPLAAPIEREVIERDQVDPTEFPGRPRLFDADQADDIAGEPAPRSLTAGPAREGPPPVPTRSGRKWLAWTAAVLVLIGAAVGVGVAYATGQFKPYHAVPSLRGDTLVEAERTVAPLHLHVSVSTRQYSAQVGAGAVVDQRPAADHRLREGQTVHVVLSLGPQPVAIPRLAGETVQVAQGQLQLLGLKWSTKLQYSGTVPQNSVIGSTPAAGAMIVPGRTVTLIISNGKPFVTVPAVAATSFGAEQAALHAVGLAATQTEDYSTTVPKGQVISIAPSTGTDVRQGTVITVQISKGPHLVQMPYVGGDSVGTAEGILKAQGFRVSGVMGDPLNTVTGTIPRGGSTVLYGSSVQIVTG